MNIKIEVVGVFTGFRLSSEEYILSRTLHLPLSMLFM